MRDGAAARDRRRRRPLLAGVAVLIVASSAAGIWILRGSGNPAPQAAPTQTVPVPPRRRRRAVHRPRPVAVLALPAHPAARTISLPILMYHRIDRLDPALPAITRRLTVAPADFAAQMAWLHGHGYQGVTQLQAFDALMRGTPLPRRPVMITFDDGYRDVLRYAAPVLVRLHIPATAYVITGRVSGPDSSFFRWSELPRLERAGIEVGSHTESHPDLTTLSTAQALSELRGSRAALQRHLGHPVQWFAYPAGAEDPQVVALAREAGYVLAVTTQPGSEQDAAHPLELHRYEVLDSTGVAGLAAMLGRP